jgi:hypothetical protein
MDNHQREQEALNQPNRETEIYEEQLREAVAAEGFFDTASGKLWVKLATAEITRITREITSEKYRKDQVGYNIALSDLLAYKRILKMMQVAASPQRKAKLIEKLEVEE